jgi:hypothetical protein
MAIEHEDMQDNFVEYFAYLNSLLTIANDFLSHYHYISELETFLPLEEIHSLYDVKANCERYLERMNYILTDPNAVREECTDCSV